SNRPSILAGHKNYSESTGRLVVPLCLPGLFSSGDFEVQAATIEQCPNDPTSVSMPIPHPLTRCERRSALRTMDLGEEKQHLRRRPWGAFPDVVIHSEERFVKTHPLYSSAKEGNAKKAEGLVEDVMVTSDLAGLRFLIGSSRPFLLPVHALETEG